MVVGAQIGVEFDELLAALERVQPCWYTKYSAKRRTSVASREPARRRMWLSRAWRASSAAFDDRAFHIVAHARESKQVRHTLLEHELEPVAILGGDQITLLGQRHHSRTGFVGSPCTS